MVTHFYGIQTQNATTFLMSVLLQPHFPSTSSPIKPSACCRPCCVVPPRSANRRSVTPALESATPDFCLCPTSHFPRASDESGTARRSQKCNKSPTPPVFFQRSLIKKRNSPGDSQRPRGAGARNLATATHFAGGSTSPSFS